MLPRYASARGVRWFQEGPANVGGGRHVRPRIETTLPEGARLHLVARKASPTPATGFYPMHVEEERVLIERAFAAAMTSAPPLSSVAPTRRGASA